MIAWAALAAIVSAGPQALAVTVYRDPGRGDRGIELRHLNGFALVTETRTIALPAGEATIRFEGVAGGIVPASAIVEGLPGGVIEKNRDARLLSPASLVDGMLGRRVTLRRTDRATGAVREEEAEIVAGPVPGVVLRTRAGIETLGCSGLPEKPVYDGVPADLSAKPTLSVLVRSPAAQTATVKLSYLASRFDWSASYVVTIAPDGRTLDLFGWLTLANGNAERFPDAETQAVAGRLARERVEPLRAAAARLSLTCYPLGTTTSMLPERETIVVTAQRNFEASMMRVAAPMMAPPPPAPPPPPPPPEDLGDLKLYRVPERVTIAANGQKQVALLEKRGAPFVRVYLATVYPGARLSAAPTRIMLRLRNEQAAGLGIPLPAGSTTLYTMRGGQRLLVGTGRMRDVTKGERLLVASGLSHTVTLSEEGTKRRRLTIANANPFTIDAEIAIGAPRGTAPVAPTAALPRIDGIPTWRVTVPANGHATLGYSMP